MRPLGSPSPEARDTCNNKKVWQAQPEAGTTGTGASAQGSGVCLGGDASKHLFWIHPAEDTLFGTAEIRGSRNLDQTLGGGGGRMRNWLGMRQTCSWPLVKTRAFFPTFQEDTPPPWPPPNRYILHPLLVPQASSLSVSKALFVDVEAKARRYNCTPHQDKQTPVQRLS